MNFYKHYIGDFQRDTGHLSLTERGAYLALMQHYYATEQALPVDHAALCRIAGAFSKPERDAVKVVVAFFERRDGQLWHKRIEAELEKQEGRADINRKIALEREARKRAERLAEAEHEATTNRAPDVPGTSHDQSTIQNQSHSSLRSEEGKAPRKRAASSPIPRPDDVGEQVWCDWVQLRKGKRAAVSVTVVAEARKEAGKAGLSLERFLAIWCARGSQGLEASWLKPHELAPRTGPPSFADQARNRMDALAGRTQPKPQGLVIDAATGSVDQRDFPAHGPSLRLEA